MDKVPQMVQMQVKSSMQGHLSYLNYQRKNTASGRNTSLQDSPKLYNSSQIKRTKLFHKTVGYKPGSFFSFFKFLQLQ